MEKMPNVRRIFTKILSNVQNNFIPSQSFAQYYFPWSKTKMCRGFYKKILHITCTTNLNYFQKVNYFSRHQQRILKNKHVRDFRALELGKWKTANKGTICLNTNKKISFSCRTISPVGVECARLFVNTYLFKSRYQ